MLLKATYKQKRSQKILLPESAKESHNTDEKNPQIFISNQESTNHADSETQHKGISEKRTRANIGNDADLGSQEIMREEYNQ